MGDVSYTKAIVTFVDLLGFKEAVNKKSASEVNDILNAFLKCMQDNYASHYEEAYKTPPLTYSAVFSDSVLRVTYLDHPINDYHPYGAVFHEVLALSHGLMNLFPAGIMFRGAISVGDIFVDPENNKFFGPALLEATKIESEIGTPCIALSDSVIKTNKDPKYVASQNTPEQEEGFLESLLAEGKVGSKSAQYRFIDIFKAADSEADCFEDWLWMIRGFIFDGCKKFKDDEVVLRKYNWLKVQFNNYVSGLDDTAVYEHMGMGIADLRIRSNK